MKREELNMSVAGVEYPSASPGPTESVRLSGGQVEALTNAIRILADEAIAGNRLVKAVVLISSLGFIGSIVSLVHVSTRFDDATERAREQSALFERQREKLLASSSEAVAAARKAVAAAREAAAESAEAAAESADVTLRLAPRRERPALAKRAAQKKAKAMALSARR